MGATASLDAEAKRRVAQSVEELLGKLNNGGNWSEKEMARIISVRVEKLMRHEGHLPYMDVELLRRHCVLQLSRGVKVPPLSLGHISGDGCPPVGHEDGPRAGQAPNPRASPRGRRHQSELAEDPLQTHCEPD